MAYDQTGATVGAAGHDAAELAAAVIASNGEPFSPDEAFGLWKELRDQILDNSLEVQGVTSLAANVGASRATPISSAPSAGGGDFGDVLFKGGKHQGKTISQVNDEAPDYLEWIAGNESYKNDYMRTRIVSFLAAQAA